MYVGGQSLAHGVSQVHRRIAPGGGRQTLSPPAPPPLRVSSHSWGSGPPPLRVRSHSWGSGSTQLPPLPPPTQPAAGSLQAGLLAPVPVWVHGLRIYILFYICNHDKLVEPSIRCEFTARVSGGGMGVSPSRLREVPQGVRVCEKSGLG